MICPKDQVQMHQATEQDPKAGLVFLGGGENDEDKYTTWTIQECPACGRRVKESYSCELIK